MKHLKSFNEDATLETEVNFTSKRNPNISFSVFKTPDGRITRIENCNVRFPFRVGQMFNRTAEVWACNNNFLMDGKDTCPEKKIFGVRTKDVPQGHEWRMRSRGRPCSRSNVRPWRFCASSGHRNRRPRSGRARRGPSSGPGRR